MGHAQAGEEGRGPPRGFRHPREHRPWQTMPGMAANDRCRSDAMSRSCWLVGVEFHMLDARKECVPGFEDWSSGHIPFKTRAKMRVYGPSSFAVDDQYGALPFDKDKWAEYVANEIVTDLTF